jgi:hypothetical protein
MEVVTYLYKEKISEFIELLLKVCYFLLYLNKKLRSEKIVNFWLGFRFNYIYIDLF